MNKCGNSVQSSLTLMKRVLVRDGKIKDHLLEYLRIKSELSYLTYLRGQSVLATLSWHTVGPLDFFFLARCL